MIPNVTQEDIDIGGVYSWRSTAALRSDVASGDHRRFLIANMIAVAHGFGLW